MADLLNLGGSAASVAVNPESPTAWLSLGKSIGSALGLFGGGSTPSILQGLRLSGTASAGGLSGVSVTAFDQQGNTWNADPSGANNRWFAEVGSTLWDRFSNAVGSSRIAGTLGSSSVAVNVAVPVQTGEDGTTQLLRLGQAVNDKFRAAFGTAPMTNDDIAAPTIPATSQPAGSVDPSGAGLLVGGGTGSGGSSSVAPAPAAATGSNNGPAWLWIVLALGAYHVMSKH